MRVFSSFFLKIVDVCISKSLDFLRCMLRVLDGVLLYFTYCLATSLCNMARDGIPYVYSESVKFPTKI